MIACDTFHVKLSKTLHKILYLSTAFDETFAFLAVVSTGRDALYHCDRFGNILYQYKFQFPVDSFAMMNNHQVVILYPRGNKIYLFNLLLKKCVHFSHQFMNEESDQSQLYCFSETASVCVKEKGKLHDHRLHLTYYQYPFKIDHKASAKYQSIDNQWTTEMEVFKGNNHSMVIWCKRRNDEEIDVRTFDRRRNAMGVFKQYRFKNILAGHYNMSRLQISISCAFELRENDILLVCISNKGDCRVTNKDGVVNNNFVLNTEIPQSPFLRECKFYFQKEYNHYLIDYRNLGKYSMFRTYEYRNRAVQLSPVYYIDNSSEQVVTKQFWKCSYLHKYYIPGHTSNAFVQSQYENGHVHEFTVHQKRILNPSPAVTARIEAMQVQFDESLLADAYGLLEQ